MTVSGISAAALERPRRALDCKGTSSEAVKPRQLAVSRYTSVPSAKVKASSTSTPRYRTVLSILHHVASTQLAIDGEVEQSPIAQPAQLQVRHLFRSA
jgi:hypothetical protein